MRKLDRFILKSYVGPFAATLLVVIFILMMEFLWLYIDELVGKGLGLRVIMEFLMWGVLTVLPLALPLSTLLAAVMTVGGMAEKNELFAMKSSGLPLTRIFAPIIGAAVVISVGAWFSGNYLVPKAYNEIFTLRDDIGRTKSEIKIPTGVFYEGIDGYILHVEKQNDEGTMYGVLVYDHTNRGGGNKTITVADSASMVMSKGKDYLLFDMYDGESYRETNDMRYRDTTLQLETIRFSKQELVIPLKNYAFRKSEDTRFGDQAKSMRLKDLHYEQDSLQRTRMDIQRKQYRYFLMLGYLHKHEQLDTSKVFAHSIPFEDEKFMKWDERGKEERAYQNASDKIQEISNVLATNKNELYEVDFYLRRASVEILKRLAQALACFILLFVGAPIGTLVKKGGLGVGAIISVMFFLLYYVIDIIGTKLANDGAMNIAAGVFISTFAFTIIGTLLMKNAVNDAQLFSMDSIKFWWKRKIRRFKSIFHKNRIVFMGTPEFAVASLDALVSKGYKVVGVVTVADKPSGRGLQMNESAVKKYALSHNIPVLQPLKLKDPEFLNALRKWKADLFVVVAFRMLPEDVWRMPKFGTFNLHAALLPQYRGAAPINWAVINGEKMTGVTSFMIDKDIDTGGIMLRQESRISETDTAGDVHDALMEIGSKIVVETVEGIFLNNIETRVQRSFIQGSEILKIAPKISRELCHIDWNDTSRNIYNLIRGLSPYPTAFTELAKEGTEPLQLKIFKAQISERTAPAGTIISDGKTYMDIGTSDGSISLLDIQLAGKKRMDIKSFLLGWREPESWGTTEGTSKAEIAKTKQ